MCAFACGCLRGGGGGQPARGCNCWRPWSADVRRRHLRKGPSLGCRAGPGRQADPGLQAVGSECLEEWVTPGLDKRLLQKDGQSPGETEET